MVVHVPGLQVQVRDVLVKGHDSWRDVAFILLLVGQAPSPLAGQTPSANFQFLPFVFDPEAGTFSIVLGTKLRMK